MTGNESYSELRLILGDQLNARHSWFSQPRGDVLYVLMEIRPESEYVVHHIQKITGFFLAMRSFAGFLKDKGFRVRYFHINDSGNLHSFRDNLQQLARDHRVKAGSFMEPDEYRLDRLLEEAFSSVFETWSCVSSEHFFTNRTELPDFFAGKKTWLMESFYRHMRKKHKVLIEPDGQPVGGRWNFDRENRSRLPGGLIPPDPVLPEHDVSGIVDEIQQAGLPSFGRIDATHFHWPAGRGEALLMLNRFIEQRLPSFGRYQDAMAEASWTVYHSLLSFALNLKMIAPGEVVEAAEKAWEEDPDAASIAQVEGFIRQILGWREYMRGIYWAKMPAYEQLNYFEHTAPLPGWFWTGNTGMNCLRQAIGQSLEHAYAHHIQRLMVTGNFALLAGVHPDETDRWYLGIYIDAVQWVEITNTRGMSQFADGGIVGTKPYVSSAAYIDRMSDYCSRCKYDPKKKTGAGACPFNSLYWHFHDRHRELLGRNPRIAMMYRTWDRMKDDVRRGILVQAEQYLEDPDLL